MSLDTQTTQHLLTQFNIENPFLEKRILVDTDQCKTGGINSSFSACAYSCMAIPIISQDGSKFGLFHASAETQDLKKYGFQLSHKLESFHGGVFLPVRGNQSVRHFNHADILSKRYGISQSPQLVINLGEHLKDYVDNFRLLYKPQYNSIFVQINDSSEVKQFPVF